jgi:dTDP-glucose 4,6-dehydratase
VNIILDLVDELAPSRGTPRSEIQFVADRPGHDRRYAIDCTKLETNLGWRAHENFDTGIRKTVHWYLDREDWWGPLLAGDFKGQRLGLRG